MRSCEEEEKVLLFQRRRRGNPGVLPSVFFFLLLLLRLLFNLLGLLDDRETKLNRIRPKNIKKRRIGGKKTKKTRGNLVLSLLWPLSE